MDFSNLSHEELAAVGAAWFAEVEGRLTAWNDPEAPECLELTKRAHRRMNRVRRKVAEGGEIAPFSGGDPKPEEP